MTLEPAPTLAQFFAAWELFGTPAIAGTIAGALLGALGVYVLVRRMVFLSAALSQAAGLGVACAFLFHVPPSLGASVFTALAAAPFFGRTKDPRGERRDAWMGLTWIVGAAGALVVGTRIVDAEDVHGVLFGTAVVVLPEQFAALVALALVIGVLHVWWLRGFVQIAVDREGARVRGLPVRVLEVVLLATLALAISVCTRILGALPVFAFSVLPALAALRSVGTVPRALVLAAVVGGASGFAGYLVAFLYAFPVGASQAMVGVGFALLAEAIARVRGR